MGERPPSVLLGALLLIPPCANIAILVYARTMTRREEFALRTALGASRERIVTQLFVELILWDWPPTGAGIIGFLFARQFSGRLSRVTAVMGPDNLPFWIDFTPSLPTILCVAGLECTAAALAGGVPAWHATGRWRAIGVVLAGQPRLRRAARKDVDHIAVEAGRVDPGGSPIGRGDGLGRFSGGRSSDPDCRSRSF